MTAYYNDTDKFCCDWLGNLIDAGHISLGVIDQRSIHELEPNDLSGYERVHLFAGIAGWDYALNLAGWPAGVPVWTGSCPCQPFSCAGKGLGTADKRHLWPEMFRLIHECRPGVVFGEQVASAVGHGWLDGVFADLEGEGYACWATVAGAHSVGAPHIRQRLYWVADASWSGRRLEPECTGEQFRRPHAGGKSATGGVAITKGVGLQIAGSEPGCSSEPSGGFGRLADGIEPGLEGYAGDGSDRSEPGRFGKNTAGSVAASGDSCWAASRWHPCRDGKCRRIPLEPALFPLAHGLPGRVGQLRAAGNSIVPQLAAAFIKTVMEAMWTPAPTPIGGEK